MPAPLLAQVDRIRGEIDGRHTATLNGNVHPYAQPQFDEGPVDPSTKLNYVTLTLKTSASKQAALDRLLFEQQDPYSPNYRKWLTPEEYADRYGASPADVSKIEAWMQSEGFEIVARARSRRWVAFNGSAQQIESALHTEIRHYRVNGELHFANAGEPSVPAAIQPMVLGFQGLHDFQGRHMSTVVPHITNGNTHTLAPGDVETIYHISPLYHAGIDGSGQKIVIVGTSNLLVSDIRQFRSMFGLPAKDPQVVLVPGSVDPGIPANNGESNLDTEWAGAIAPNAEIVYVFAPSYWTVLNYAVDQNLAPVISMSYYWCEKAQAGGDAKNVQSLAQQANAQGITWLACSGDAGAEGCDPGTTATHGLSVSIYTAAPEVTGIGGTTFSEGNGTYWGPNAGSTQPTALGYIPETAWTGSGGGYSTFYAKPTWQPLASNETMRGVPDISFTADPNHDAYTVVNNGKANLVGGTSAPTPMFAGVLALLNQYLGANGLGNINPNLYRLAQTTSTIFHDVTTGNNFSPCKAGSPDCIAGRVAVGYTAIPGWDAVTGLGSVDVNNLVTHWKDGSIGTTTSVTASPSSFTLSDSTKLTVTVSSVSSNVTPTGTITITRGSSTIGSATLGGSGSSASATVTVYGSQLPAGNDTLTATYGGDTQVNGSAGSVTVIVSVPVATSAVIPTISPNPVFEQDPDSDGYSWFYTIRLTEVAGAATKLTGFSIDGVDYTTSIVSFFGTSSIPANGTLAASLRTRDLNVPASRAFVFSGIDTGGRQWTQQINAPFLGTQISASMELVGVPGTIRQDPTADSDCQWFQNLGLQEVNGHSVQLTRFLAGGQDLSDSITDFFGSTTLPAFGSLFTGLCWTIADDLPETLSYEIDGIDDGGRQIVATQSALFIGPAAKPGTLSTSVDPNNGEIVLSVPGPAQSTSGRFNVNVSPGLQWTISVFPSNRTTSWLVAWPLSGTGPATVNLSAAGAGQANGLHSATLVVQSVDAVPESINVTVTFVVGQPKIASIVNGASLTDTGLSPGLIFTVYGSAMGPSAGQTLALDDNGRVATELSGVQVLVNGTPAPLLFVRADQINAVAPYEIADSAGQHVNVQVVNNGVQGNAISEAVVKTAPAIFSLGNGQGAILNQDGTVNGPSNPAAKGSVITIYATGEGQTNPAGIDGRLAFDPLANLPRPVAPVLVSIGGTNAVVIYDGAAPTSFAGFFQVNAVVPSSAASGNVPVKLTVGGISSPALNVVVR